MNQMTQLLMGFVAPGAWRVSEVGPADGELASALGMRWQKVDLAEVDSKAALMQGLATDLELPKYFGKNWDGLEECLNDETAPGVVVIENASKLVDSDSALAATLAEVLNDVCDGWSQAGIRASVVWVGGWPEAIPAIPGCLKLESPNTV